MYLKNVMLLLHKEELAWDATYVLHIASEEPLRCPLCAPLSILRTRPCGLEPESCSSTLYCQCVRCAIDSNNGPPVLSRCGALVSLISHLLHSRHKFCFKHSRLKGSQCVLMPSSIPGAFPVGIFIGWKDEGCSFLARRRRFMCSLTLCTWDSPRW